MASPSDHEGGIPPVHELIRDRPTSWNELDVQWTSDRRPDPVLIARLSLPTEGRGADEVWLFAARHELSEALVDGVDLGGGYFVEYFVVEQAGSAAWRVHRLLQRSGVAYSELEDRDAREPMRRIAQLDTADPGLGPRLDVFLADVEGENVFEILVEDPGEQSADQHYEDEERRWRS